MLRVWSGHQRKRVNKEDVIDAEEDRGPSASSASSSERPIHLCAHVGELPNLVESLSERVCVDVRASEYSPAF